MIVTSHKSRKYKRHINYRYDQLSLEMYNKDIARVQTSTFIIIIYVIFTVTLAFERENCLTQYGDPLCLFISKYHQTEKKSKYKINMICSAFLPDDLRAIEFLLYQIGDLCLFVNISFKTRIDNYSCQ